MTQLFSQDQLAMNQGQYIRYLINSLIEQGFTDKIKIYDEISKLKFPRPTIRRVAIELTAEMKSKVAILSVKEKKTFEKVKAEIEKPVTEFIPILESEIQYSPFPLEKPSLVIQCKSHADFKIKKEQILALTKMPELKDILCFNCGKKIGKGVIIPDKRACYPDAAYCPKCWEKHADV